MNNAVGQIQQIHAGMILRHRSATGNRHFRQGEGFLGPNAIQSRATRAEGLRQTFQVQQELCQLPRRHGGRQGPRCDQGRMDEDLFKSLVIRYATAALDFK